LISAGGLAFEALLAPVHHHAADGGIGPHRDLGVLDPPRPHHLETELLDGDGDLPEPQPFEVLRIECRRADKKREAPKEIHAPAFRAPTSTSATPGRTSRKTQACNNMKNG
jgi:hypothetical protein